MNMSVFLLATMDGDVCNLMLLGYNGQNRTDTDTNRGALLIQINCTNVH